MIGQTLRPVPIGRDVVIDVPAFDMVGRRFRNLRQAVQRTHNFGITTEIVAEQELDDDQLAELTDVLLSSPKGARTERGFSMILDGALTGHYPGILLIIARDRAGRVQGFHRYALAGGGSDVTLDVPWRRRGAPNGIDERLSVDMIEAMKDLGAQRLSLAFAAFPEIFNDKERGPLQQLLLHRDPPRRLADRAGVAVPVPAQVSCPRRPPVRAAAAESGAAAAGGLAVAGVPAAAAAPAGATVSASG